MRLFIFITKEFKKFKKIFAITYCKFAINFCMCYVELTRLFLSIYMCYVLLFQRVIAKTHQKDEVHITVQIATQDLPMQTDLLDHKSSTSTWVIFLSKINTSRV